jgi:hypothetical protein
MKAAEEAWCGGGPRRWRCSEERCAALTCPTSRGRIGDEEGRGQSRLEGLGMALTSGGGRRRGLDKIQRGERVPVPGNWLNELSGVQGCAWSRGGVLMGKRMASAVGTLLGSRGTKEEERGWWGSSAGSATRRKEEGRLGFGRATRRRTAWGAWRGLAPTGARGRWGRVAVVQCVRAGGMGRRVWAAREHVDRPEGNDGAGPGPKEQCRI